MLKINNKIEFENNLWLGIVDSSEFNSSEEDRIKAVTDIASITKGRLGFKETTYKSMDLAAQYGYEHFEKRKKLYNRLLKESAGKPSTPFEFVPYKEPLYKEYSKSYTKYGNLEIIQNKDTDEDFYFYTNLRNVLSIDNTIFNNSENEVKDFKIIIGRVPFKVIEYLNGKSSFSFIYELQNESEEVYKKYLNKVKFWYPSWWNELQTGVFKYKDGSRISDLISMIECKEMKPEEATMELSDRRLVTFAMAAWLEPNAWDNLFAIRGEKTGTQSITKIVVDNIKTLINE